MSWDEPVYELLGREEGIRRLVDRFYVHMDTLPEAAGIRAMHPDLDQAADRLTWFLITRFGGPPVYHEKRGHPMLRRRHFPFAIGAAEAEAWMACMRLALAEEVEEVALREVLEAFFAQVAEHMRNQPE